MKKKDLKDGRRKRGKEDLFNQSNAGVSNLCNHDNRENKMKVTIGEWSPKKLSKPEVLKMMFLVSFVLEVFDFDKDGLFDGPWLRLRHKDLQKNNRDH